MKARILRRAAAGALALTLIGATAALADKIEGDADALATSAPAGNSVTTSQPIGSTVAYDLSASIDETGNAMDDVFPGTLAVSIARSGAWVAADAGSPTSFTFTAYDTNAAGKVRITVPCEAEVGDVETMTVVLTAGASTNGKVLNPDSVTLTYEITATADTAGVCDSSNEPPTAGFTYSPANPDEGESVTFTDESTDSDGTIEAWSWAFGDGATSVAQNPTHTYEDDGTYEVCLTVTDDDGATDSACHEVAVSNVAPSLTASLTASIDCRTNASLALAFTDPGSVDNPWSVDVNWGDGSPLTEFDAATQGPQADLTHLYTAPGTYTVSVTVTDKDGGSDTDSHQVEVLQTYATTFLAPFDASSPSNLVTNTMKNGRVVPVKIKLYDECALGYVTDPTELVTIKVPYLSQTSTGSDPVETYADAGQSSAGTDRFRWSTDGFWNYNLDSKALGLITDNTYRVDAYVDSVKATTDTWALLKPVK